MSFTTTPNRIGGTLSAASFINLWRRVVFPLPRNPERRVTGSFGECFSDMFNLYIGGFIFD
jgi:hypothetical protein